MDDLRHGSIGVGQQLKQCFVGGETAGLQNQRSDGYEFILSIVVVYECVEVEGIDDVGNGQDFEWMLKLRGRSAVPSPL